MSTNLIESRLKQYDIRSQQEELNALKEIIQELALAALSRTDFFKIAGFQGGTSLRIIYGLYRFSEDLDFVLIKPDLHFKWDLFLKNIQLEFETYGLHLEVQDRSKVEDTIKKAFLKENSFGQVLTLSFPRKISDIQKIRIKLEIDTRPPEGSQFETKFLDFPYPYSIVMQDLPSLFAGKCHALLCRSYTKGRDWFDFVWYASRKTPINYKLLQNALYQTGPWQNENLKITKQWITTQLKEKIETIDWKYAKDDVIRFLKPREAESLQLWSGSFFINYVEKLEEYLTKE